MEEKYIEKKLKEASEYESEGRVETAINIYEELGGEYLEDGISIALHSGLLKKCMNLLLQKKEISRAKLVRENVKYNSRSLQKYLVKTLKRSKLSIDLWDPLWRKEFVNKKEFKPYFKEIQYRN